MVLLRKLQLANFLSHEKTDLFFNDNQKLLIDGLSGSGKSSIVEAITWALYGIGRSDNRFLVKRGAKRATVKLLLFDDTDNKYYHIIRSITDKKHELEVLHGSGEPFVPVLINGIRGLQEFIEKEILHCSYQLFLNSICYQQDNPEGFAQQTAVKRKDLLLEIIKASDYDEYYNKAKDLISEYKEESISLNGGITVQEVRLGVLEESIKDLSLLSEQNKLIEEVNSLKLILEDIEQKENNQHEIQNKIAELRGKTSTLENFLTTKKQNIEALNKEISELESLDLVKLELEHEKYQQIKTELKEAEAQKTLWHQWVEKRSKLDQLMPIDESIIQKEKGYIDQAVKQIVELKNNNGTKCNHCGKVCERCELRLKQSTKYFDDQIINHEYNINAYGKNLKEKEEAHKALGEEPKFDFEAYNSLVKRNDELHDFEQEYSKISERDKELRYKHEALAKINLEISDTEIDKTLFVNELEALSKQIIDYSSKKLLIKQEIEVKEQRVFELNLILSNAKNDKEEKDKIELSVKKEKEIIKELGQKIEGLELLKDAFGNNGIKAIIVDYIIPKLEDRINAILSELSAFGVRLDTQKSGAGKDVILEGLFISIINDRGELLEYSNYSGGERLKIAVAISEALAELQKIGFRILDELFIGIDEASLEGFVNVLQKLQKRFSQLLCISHLRNIKDLFQETITVKKLNGTSEIV